MSCAEIAEWPASKTDRQDSEKTTAKASLVSPRYRLREQPPEAPRDTFPRVALPRSGLRPRGDLRCPARVGEEVVDGDGEALWLLTDQEYAFPALQIEPGDRDALTQAMNWALENQDTLRRISQRAHDTVFEHFRFQETENRYLALYEGR